MIPTVSIIIVAYKNNKVLLQCLRSIYKQKTKTPFEVIIVDNDEKNTASLLFSKTKHSKQKNTKEKVIQVKKIKNIPPVLSNTYYIPASKNLGYGGGNNLGSKFAKGEFLFFLNPDTKIKNNILDPLVSFLRNNTHYAIVAPTLEDANNQVFEKQGTQTLTPIRALFSLSFLCSVLPYNPVARLYWMKDIDKTKDRDVDVVPGTAFMIRRSLFKRLNGFDESFFLYFEEFDVCKRVIDLGYRCKILGKPRIIHEWGQTTKFLSHAERDSIFRASRQHYFKKHFGVVWMMVVEVFLRKWRRKNEITE